MLKFYRLQKWLFRLDQVSSIEKISDYEFTVTLIQGTIMQFHFSFPKDCEVKYDNLIMNLNNATQEKENG